MEIESQHGVVDVKTQHRMWDHEMSFQEVECRRNLTFNFVNSFPYVSTVNQGNLVLGNFPCGEDDHARRAPGTLECLENARNSGRLFGMVITEILVPSHTRVVAIAHPG